MLAVSSRLSNIYFPQRQSSHAYAIPEQSLKNRSDGMNKGTPILVKDVCSRGKTIVTSPDPEVVELHDLWV